MREVRNVGDIYRIILGFAKDTKYLNINRTYAGKLRNPVSPRYLCVKNNDLLS